MTYTEIISSLKKAGFRLKEKETTAGAKKAWLDAPVQSKSECMQAALKALPVPASLSDDEREIHGRGFECEFQTYSGKACLFIAVYQKGRRGLEYEMGIDC